MGETVKPKQRFCVLFLSLLAGCAGGWWYFEQGSTLAERTASKNSVRFSSQEADVCWSSDIRGGRAERMVRVFTPIEEKKTQNAPPAVSPAPVLVAQKEATRPAVKEAANAAESKETAAQLASAEVPEAKTTTVPEVKIADVSEMTMETCANNIRTFSNDFQNLTNSLEPTVQISVSPTVFQFAACEPREPRESRAEVREIDALKGDFQEAAPHEMVGRAVEMTVRSPEFSELDRAGTDAAAALASLPENPAETPVPAEISNPAQNPTPAEVAETVKSDVETPTEAPRTYALRIDNQNIRKALADFQTETGLKVAASLDVQGNVSCDTTCENPELLLGQLLAGTPFQFVRSGNFVYVGHSDRLENLPQPLESTETRLFQPQNISLDELELVFRTSLSQFGTCKRVEGPTGGEALEVSDWVLTLNQLEEVQKLIDTPAAENRMNAYVFQHEMAGSAAPLQLKELADNRGLVIQPMAIPGMEQASKKSLFKKLQKKEAVTDVQAYSISFRADTFMIGVKDQLNVRYAPMQGAENAPMQLDTPMNFEFGLNVNGETVPYALSLTFHRESTPLEVTDETEPAAAQDETAAQDAAVAQDAEIPGAEPSAENEAETQNSIVAAVVCRPIGTVEGKSKPKTFEFQVPMPQVSGKALVFQLNLGEFEHKDEDKRKNPTYVMHGNRVKEEVVVVFNPYKQAREAVPTTLSVSAVNALIHEQEVLGRRFYGSMDVTERRCSTLCFGIAQKLRASR